MTATETAWARMTRRVSRADEVVDLARALCATADGESLPPSVSALLWQLRQAVARCDEGE